MSDKPGHHMQLHVWFKCEKCGTPSGEFKVYPDAKYICEKCRHVQDFNKGKINE